MRRIGADQHGSLRSGSFDSGGLRSHSDTTSNFCGLTLSRRTTPSSLRQMKWPSTMSKELRVKRGTRPHDLAGGQLHAAQLGVGYRAGRSNRRRSRRDEIGVIQWHCMLFLGFFASFQTTS